MSSIVSTTDGCGWSIVCISMVEQLNRDYEVNECCSRAAVVYKVRPEFFRLKAPYRRSVPSSNPKTLKKKMRKEMLRKKLKLADGESEGRSSMFSQEARAAHEAIRPILSQAIEHFLTYLQRLDVHLQEQSHASGSVASTSGANNIIRDDDLKGNEVNFSDWIHERIAINQPDSDSNSTLSYLLEQTSAMAIYLSICSLISSYPSFLSILSISPSPSLYLSIYLSISLSIPLSIHPSIDNA